MAHALAAVAFWWQIFGGAWDIESHLADRPEFFWTPPHVVLYSGIGLTFAACANGLWFARLGAVPRRLTFGMRLALVGGLVQFSAGILDSWWHEAFGLDNALSPPHVLMISAMVFVGGSLVKGFGSLFQGEPTLRVEGAWSRRLLQATSVFAATGWLFALLGIAWVFVHPGFGQEPLVAEAAQRQFVAAEFAAVLLFSVFTSRGVLRGRWTATATIGLYGLSIVAIRVLMGTASVETVLTFPLFPAAGFLIDAADRYPRTPPSRVAALGTAGVVVGMLSLILLEIPAGDMIGGLSANPPTILASYALGGLVGALLGVPAPRFLRMATPAIRPTAVPGAIR